MSKTTRGSALIYNGGLQAGGGFLDTVAKGARGAKKAHDVAKSKKLVTKAGDLANLLGVTSFLDSKSGGLFSKGVSKGKQLGFGKTVTKTRTVTRTRRRRR